jgi:hypothetical protein
MLDRLKELYDVLGRALCLSIVQGTVIPSAQDSVLSIEYAAGHCLLKIDVGD